MKQLGRLTELQNSKNDGGDNKRIIEEQQIIVLSLLQYENIEEQVVKRLVNALHTTEAHKEFSISKADFQKLLRERDYVNGLIYHFSEQFNQLRQKLGELSELLDNELKSGTSAELIGKEKALISGLNH